MEFRRTCLSSWSPARICSVVLAVGLAGCDVGKTTTILDVDCGTLKLRFEERFHSLLLSNTQPRGLYDESKQRVKHD
jgi:hypothetical protein